MNTKQTPFPEKDYWSKGSAAQGGFALFTTLIIVVIVGILAISGLRTTELNQVLAGNSIQRSRALQGAEGGLIEAERSTAAMVERRVFSSSNAADGIFSRHAIENYWWRDDEFEGAWIADEDDYPGVVDPPTYVIEEIGHYESDGGSRIVNLDRGGAQYGLRTATGREVVLYRLQSKGVGSTDGAQALVESLYIKSQ
ncbi:MAG: PilX N-terminal domain-containing pilus assembly protein [Granulosicoccus sp.]